MPAFSIILICIVIGYLIAFTRKGSVRRDTLGARRRELFNSADPAIVFDRLATLNGRIQVDDKDPATKVLVLSSPVTFFTWGFVYPVYLHAERGGTKIEVGIKSKFFQIGPLVTRAHDECLAAIEQALSVPTARVA